MVVTGQRPLRGRHLDTRDLRSGMALIAAALAAEGESVVAPLEAVERGSERGALRRHVQQPSRVALHARDACAGQVVAPRQR